MNIGPKMNEPSPIQSLKIFWDIDGTLLNTKGAAAEVFASTVSKFAGQNVKINRKDLSGYTDYEIAESLLESIGIKASIEDIKHILNEYVTNLPKCLEARNTEIIGCVRETLDKLSQLSCIELAIGTGNCQAGAKAKLEFVNLINYFNHKNIFCATEFIWNRDLVLKKANESLEINQTGVVVGDSVKDILSAKRYDLPIISVATGVHSVSDLIKHNPDCILESNWNYKEFCVAIQDILSTRSLYIIDL